MTVEERLSQLKREGINVTVLLGDINSTIEKFCAVIDMRYLDKNPGKNPILARFSDESAEIVLGKNRVKYFDFQVSRIYQEKLKSCFDYALKEAMIKESEDLCIEVHAIYEPSLGITHYFVLPDRSYLEDKTEEKTSKPEGGYQ